jgi:Na+/H+-dicarboxylate symporter
VTSEKRKVPLFVRVLLGVALGIATGVAFGTRPILFSFSTETLGSLGLLVIRLLKALAAPLILVAVVDSFVRTRITAREGKRFIAICLVNVSVAFTIGLLVLNLFQPGKAWRGRIDLLSVRSADGSLPKPGDAKPTLDPLKNIAGYVPESLVEPFLKNNVISIVLAGILFGAALRRVLDREERDGGTGARNIASGVAALYEILILMLMWVVEAIPFAVFAVVAQVVGRSGVQVFGALGLFLGTILLGLLVHALVYYPLAAWAVGGKSPREYLGKGADAIVTGLSMNSSLATVPLTLACLKRMGVSEKSARLSACVGTNLNNDGITLYEAMASLFLAQAFGYDLTIPQQLVVVLASLMAGVGVAGIPEAGLIVLPLVLGAAGLPEAAVAAAIPLILPVDWILARVRSGVNVMSDMLVAILLDATEASPGVVEPISEER